MVKIINNCIDKNVFPTAWKIARVCPVPKIDNPIDVTKYRQISVLCILSKVFERVILAQLCNYIEVKASYNLTQSGFRKDHSASTLLLKFRDDIIRAMNTTEVTLRSLRLFKRFAPYKVQKHWQKHSSYQIWDIAFCIQPTTKIFNTTSSKDSEYCSWLRTS